MGEVKQTTPSSPPISYDEVEKDEPNLDAWKPILEDDKQRFAYDQTSKHISRTLTDAYQTNWDAHVVAFDEFLVDAIPAIVATNNQASFIHKGVRTTLIASNITYSRQTYIAPDGCLSQMSTPIAQQNNYSKIVKVWQRWELIQQYEGGAVPSHSTLRMSNSARVAAGSASKVASKRRHKGTVSQKVNELSGQTKHKQRRHPFVDSENGQPIQARTVTHGLSEHTVTLPRFISGEEGSRQYGTTVVPAAGSNILHHEVFERMPLCQMPVPNGAVFSETGAPRWNGAEDVYPAMYGTLAISGNNKLISPTRRLNNNQPFVLTDGELEIRCCPFRKQHHSTDNMFVYYSNAKPKAPTSGETMTLRLQFFRGQPLPLPTLLQGLGTSQAGAEAMIRKAADGWWSEELQRRTYNLLAEWKHGSTEEALLNISRSAGGDTHRTTEDRLRFASNVLTNHVLPQVNGLTGSVAGDNEVKALMLARMAWLYMMKRMALLITVPRTALEEEIQKKFKLDDPDDTFNVRYDPGALKLANVFRQKHGIVMGRLRNMLEKFLLEEHPVISLKFLFKHPQISGGIASSFSTNNFGGNKHSGKKAQTQVCQLVNQWNFRATYDQASRVAPSSGPETKQVKARQVVTSQAGAMCTSRSPEGGSCGLVGFIAWLARITGGTDPFLLTAVLWRNLAALRLVLPSQWAQLPDRGVKFVYVSGILVGFTLQPEVFVARFLKLRRSMVLDPMASVCYQPHDPSLALEVWCDAGRYAQPLIRLSALRRIPHEALQSVSVDQLIRWQVVEYVDTSEMRMWCVGWDMDDIWQRRRTNPTLPLTHMVVHPRNFLGPSAGMVVHSNRIAGPRTSYAAGQANQACGPDLSTRTKMGPNRAALHNGQRSLFMTDIEMSLGPQAQLDGQVAMTGLTTYLGWAQDDAIIMGAASAERGFGHMSYYKHFRDDEKKDGSAITKQQYHKPPPGVWGKKRAVDTHINPKEGWANLNAVLPPHAVVIGKSVPIKRKVQQSSHVRQAFNERPSLRDASIVRKGDSDPFCVVVKVVKNINTKGLVSIKVVVRSFRDPVAANKWATGHGQKGIIAIMMPQEDMPWDPVTGMSLDMLGNSNSLTSRMTVSWLTESAYSLIALYKGEVIDATPYQDMRLQGLDVDTGSDLAKCGQPRSGARIMCNGLTGEMMETPITVGPIHFKPLKHFRCEKQRVRGRGQVQSLTRQPTEGRARDGGLRFGEMERDCLLSQGDACMLAELFGPKSDATWPHFCNQCNLLSIGDKRQHRYQCRGCNSTTSVEVVPTTHANKLLLQEQMAMLVKPRTFVRLLDQPSAAAAAAEPVGAVRAGEFADTNEEDQDGKDDEEDEEDEEDDEADDMMSDDEDDNVAVEKARRQSSSSSSAQHVEQKQTAGVVGPRPPAPSGPLRHVTWKDEASGHGSSGPGVAQRRSETVEEGATAAEEEIDLEMTAALDDDMRRDFLRVALEEDEETARSVVGLTPGVVRVSDASGRRAAAAAGGGELAGADEGDHEVDDDPSEEHDSAHLVSSNNSVGAVDDEVQDDDEVPDLDHTNELLEDDGADDNGAEDDDDIRHDEDDDEDDDTTQSGRQVSASSCASAMLSTLRGAGSVLAGHGLGNRGRGGGGGASIGGGAAALVDEDELEFGLHADEEAAEEDDGEEDQG